MTQDLVRRRIERKYVLPAGEARDLRTQLASTPAAADDVRRMAGWISTLYFDVADRRLSRAALERPDDNVKLRLREYFDEEGAPCSTFVWFEIKERRGSVSRKNRFRIHKRLVPGFLRGEVDLGIILTCQSGAQDPQDVVETIQRIYDLADESWSPIGAVRCRRCSLEGGHPAARVTLDDRITYHLGPLSMYGDHAALDRTALGPAAAEESRGILELKHGQESLPAWCRRFVDGRSPVEYSKFLLLSRLSFAEAPVD